MTPATEREWIARIFSGLMGGPAMAGLLVGLHEADADKITVGVVLLCVSQAWFMLLNLPMRRGRR